MEKDTVTIEIKQDVSITLLWIVCGVIVVSAVFLLTPPSPELWPALNAAGIAGAIYLFAMIAYALRKPLKTRLRLWVGIAAVVILALGAFTWLRMQQESKYHAETLMKVRGTIGRGVMRYDLMSTTGISTLYEFYRQHGAEKESLADVFRRKYEGAAPGLNIHKPDWDGDVRQVIVARLEPDLIELVAQETYVKGRDPLFQNYNGQFGMMQEKAMLTEKGIDYVSEN
jgi:hypothetical protein